MRRAHAPTGTTAREADQSQRIVAKPRPPRLFFKALAATTPTRGGVWPLKDTAALPAASFLLLQKTAKFLYLFGVYMCESQRKVGSVLPLCRSQG